MGKEERERLEKSGKVSSQVVVAGRCCIELMVQMAFLLPAKLSCNKYLCTKVKNWHGKRQQQCEGDTRPAGPTRAARLQPGLSPAKGHYEHTYVWKTLFLSLPVPCIQSSSRKSKLAGCGKMENKYCHYSASVLNE